MILGIDEVGRGPWAGPLVVGAVVLRQPMVGLNDSKKLTAKKRQALAAEIHESAWVGLGWVSAKELDAVGVSESIRLATIRAIEALPKEATFSEIIIDGNINYLYAAANTISCPVRAIVGADGSEPAVSAASIVAKVARDEYMTALVERYPGYGFEKHVGYGTKMHVEALLSFGVTPEHRKSYKPIARIIENSSKAL